MRMRGLLQALCFVAVRAALLNLHDESLDDFVDSLPDETLLLVDFFRVSPEKKHVGNGL